MKACFNRFLSLLLVWGAIVVEEQSLRAQEVVWTSPYGGYDVAVDGEGCVLLTGGKLSPEGDTLWLRALEGMCAFGVASDPWDDVIVTGEREWSFCTVKYSSGGDTVWTRVLDEGERACGVATDAQGNVVVTGYSVSYDPLGDYCTVKYDPYGKVLWRRFYDWRWEDFAKDVAIDGEGNIIVTGQSDNDVNWDWCTVKYGPDGDTIWVRRVDVGMDDQPFGVAADPYGNVMVVGAVDGGEGHCAAFIVTYDSTGTVLWTRRFDDMNSFRDVATDEAGNIVLVSTLYLAPTNYSTVTLKCDSEGDTLWTCRRSDLQCHGVAVDFSGNIIVTGSHTTKISGTSGIEAVHATVPPSFSLSQSYPNPSNLLTTIGYTVPRRGHVTLEVFNVLGNKVTTLVDGCQKRGAQSITWDGSPFSSGVYYYRLRAGDYSITRKLVLMK